jgi:hypothetical protein
MESHRHLKSTVGKGLLYKLLSEGRLEVLHLLPERTNRNTGVGKRNILFHTSMLL